jgi:DNA replication protein DnaC
MASTRLAGPTDTLRLSGMLDTIDARLAQAKPGDLGHLEFLQALCEDEIARRDATAVIRRVRAARFEQPTTLEDFDFKYNPTIPAATIRDLATLRFLNANESVIIHGPVGVGKTFIAQAIGHHACRHNHNVIFTKTSRLLADLAGGHADRTWNARLRKWARADLIILDDFAMRDFTPSQADDLYELVTERTTGSIVITSNMASIFSTARIVAPVIRCRDHHKFRSLLTCSIRVDAYEAFFSRGLRVRTRCDHSNTCVTTPVLLDVSGAIDSSKITSSKAKCRTYSNAHWGNELGLRPTSRMSTVAKFLRIWETVLMDHERNRRYDWARGWSSCFV